MTEEQLTLSEQYKTNPTIENYLELRTKFPDQIIEIATHGGADHLFALDSEFKKYGFDTSLIASVMDSDASAISVLSLQLIEVLVRRKEKAGTGETHLVRRGLTVPDKLIDWLICVMLDALSWNDNLYIPRDLIVLVRERLASENMHYEKLVDTQNKKHSAALIAGQLLAKGIQCSYRDVARALQLSPSTVSRWFEPGEFEKETELYARWFNSDGTLKDINER